VTADRLSGGGCRRVSFDARIVKVVFACFDLLPAASVALARSR